MAMEVLSADENNFKNGDTLVTDNHEDEKEKMQNVLMKVMQKMFSAKVVLERLPDMKIVKNEIDDEEQDFETEETNNDESLGSQDVSDKITKSCPKCKDRFKGDLSKNYCQNCNKRLIFKCNKCGKVLTSYVGIGRHVLTICDFRGYYYQCTVCFISTSVIKSDVIRHLKTQHPDAGINSIKIITQEEYQKNLIKYAYKCDKCGTRFRYKNNFAMHSRSDCSGMKDYVVDKTHGIDNVTEDFSSTKIPPRLLMKDMAVYYCGACERERELLDFRTSREEKCSDCNMTMSFMCSKCNHINTSYAGMINHLRTKCAIQKNFKCLKCQYSNPVRQVVFKHYQNVHEPKPVACHKCGVRLKNKVSLKSHLRHCQREIYLYCSVENCSFKTTHKTALHHHHNRHLLTQNSDCPKCGKKFKNQVTMRNHSYYCGIEPRFYCGHCSYVAKHKRDLGKHVSRRHLKEMNNDYSVCPKCDVVFKHAKSNKGHLRLCKTTTPRLECEYCYYMVEIDKPNLLNLHMKNTHSEQMKNNKSI